MFLLCHINALFYISPALCKLFCRKAYFSAQKGAQPFKQSKALAKWDCRQVHKRRNRLYYNRYKKLVQCAKHLHHESAQQRAVHQRTCRRAEQLKVTHLSEIFPKTDCNRCRCTHRGEKHILKRRAHRAAAVNSPYAPLKIKKHTAAYPGKYAEQKNRHLLR